MIMSHRMSREVEDLELNKSNFFFSPNLVYYKILISLKVLSTCLLWVSSFTLYFNPFRLLLV